MSDSFQSLLADYRALALTDPFQPPRDLEVYARWQQSPTEAVVMAGNLAASLCILGRDLGKDEVRYQQPLIGAAGQKVRRTLQQVLAPSTLEDKPWFTAGLAHYCITNTVPYKPLGNAPFSETTREKCRPLVERFLADLWQGDVLMPLGLGALEWCRPYGAATVDRFVALPLPAWHEAEGQIKIGGKVIRLLPLPHPSPLSQYSRHFPEWLAARIAQL